MVVREAQRKAVRFIHADEIVRPLRDVPECALAARRRRRSGRSWGSWIRSGSLAHRSREPRLGIQQPIEEAGELGFDTLDAALIGIDRAGDLQREDR